MRIPSSGSTENFEGRSTPGSISDPSAGLAPGYDDPLDAASRTYRIFGKAVCVDLDDSEAGQTLRQELSLYPAAASDSRPDLHFEHLPLEQPSGGLHNPGRHLESSDGFTAHYTMASVRFVFDEERLQRIRFHENIGGRRLLKLGRRLADIQFTSRAQRSGMIFHELALVPSVYFMDDLAPIHASAVQNENGEVILIGGTGGVGKTSLELELCLNHAYRFVADDVCVVDANGHAWPNLAYPKIYAYNLEDNPPLRRKVFANRGSLDRLHWNLRRRLGPSHVRRRLSPGELFGAYSADGGRLHLYAVLVRETRRAIQVEEISPERVADMSVAVLSTEFFEFNNHLNWHAFNRIASGEAPRTTVEEVSQRWRTLLRGVFENVTCRLIRIPIGMDHGTFKSRLPALLK